MYIDLVQSLAHSAPNISVTLKRGSTRSTAWKLAPIDRSFTLNLLLRWATAGSDHGNDQYSRSATEGVALS